jgi:hypothetical protein
MGAAESVLSQSESMAAQLQQKWAQWGTEMGRVFRTHVIDKVAQAAGGITTLAMSIQQLKNIGSIWSNGDLTTGEKLLQTIMTLSMSIGMIIPALTRLNNVFNLVNGAEEKNIITTKAMTEAKTEQATASAVSA